MSDPAVPQNPAAVAADRLESWKEIASFLKRDVRTVQRWEKKEGLPVRRLVHDKQGSVYAYKSELEAWWRAASTQARQESSEAEAEEEESEAATAVEAPTATPAAATAAPRWLDWRSDWRGMLASAAVLLVLMLAVRWIWPRIVKPTGKVTLAVRPFDNLSNDPAQDFFSQGLSEEITAQIGRLAPGRLNVVAGATSRRYKGKDPKQMAKELGAALILEGTVQRDGEHVRITAELMSPADQTLLWSSTYDKDLQDILQVQDDVAREVASHVSVTLNPPAPPARVNRAAYLNTLQGRDYWNTRGPDAVEKAMESFHKATVADANYAPAYAGLADAYALLGSSQSGVMRALEAMPQAKANAERALSLDPTLAAPHATLGYVHLVFDHDFPAAESEFKRAIDLDPGYATAYQWYGLYFITRGRTDDAIASIREAEERDPQSLAVKTALSEAFYFKRDFDHAAEYAQQAVKLEPKSALARFNLGRAWVQQQQYGQAIAQLEPVEAASHAPGMIAFLGHAYGVAGRANDARKQAAKLQQLAASRYVPAIYFALIYTGLGDRDRAFQWLDKARNERSDYFVFLAVEPMADPLRSDPRFQQLMASVRGE